jgi:hypothetical protein
LELGKHTDIRQSINAENLHPNITTVDGSLNIESLGSGDMLVKEITELGCQVREMIKR